MKKPFKVTKLNRMDSHIFPITLFSIFFAAILILVSVGSIIYVGLVNGQTANNETRGSLSYLSARLRGGDAQNAITIADGPEGDALVIREFDGEATYETRIYLYQGNLCEEYSFADTSFSPEDSTRIAETDTFKITILQDGLMVISTQQGEARFALRNTMGVEHDKA